MDRPAPRLFRQHTKAKPPEVKKHRTRRDNRQASRMLNTNSAAWKAIRRQVLSDEPLCRECAKHGRVTAGHHVDHIDGSSFNNDRSNLQPLCLKCHSRLTALHDGGFGREINRRD